MKRIGIEKEELHDLYINRKLGSIRIGQILKCNGTTVVNRLREFGIPVRRLEESHKVSWNKRTDISRERLYDLYVTRKLSSVKIGQICKCRAGTVLSRLKEFEIPFRSYKFDIRKEDLYNLYVVKKLNSLKIGQMLKCSRGTILERLRQFGIPIRTRSEVHKGKKLTKEQIRKTLRRRIPSSLETRFQKIIDKYSLPYKYVGDGKIFIERFNPDFINTNSKKVAIEVYARYYKSRRPESIEEWKRQRSRVFKQYGWSIVYFDETEVTEENVLKKLGAVL